MVNGQHVLLELHDGDIVPITGYGSSHGLLVGHGRYEPIRDAVLQIRSAALARSVLYGDGMVRKRTRTCS